MKLTDAELDEAIARARAAAHGAPFAEYNLRADGTASLRNHTTAYARHAAEWSRLCDERDRRRAALKEMETSE